MCFRRFVRDSFTILKSSFYEKAALAGKGVGDMDKKVTKLYYIFAVIGIVFAILSEMRNEVQIEDRIPAEAAQVWNEQMKQTERDGSYYYQGTLPEGDIAGKVIGYHTVHMLLEVMIDGQEVYSLTRNEGQKVKTTGYQWNFITLTEQDAGKDIIFKVTSVYTDSKPNGTFYYGAANEVERLIIKERLARFIITGAILIVGILLLVYLLLVEKEAKKDIGLLNFTIFVIMLGIWLVCESQIVELFLPWQYALVYIDHVMLMTMPIPFLLFVRQMYNSRENKLWDVYCGLNYLIITVRLLLQCIGVLDLRETLWLTHISIGLFVLFGFGFSIYEIISYKITTQVRLNMCCIMVIMISTIIELAQYRFNNISTPLGSLGFLFYSCVMGISSLRESRRLMREARESAIYRKMAYTDGLTGLFNRAAFNRDMISRVIGDGKDGNAGILPTTLFMFDLNDLKKCNDNYGHEYGDRYITMVSKGLKKIFETVGNCYRIGGDEFCALISDTSQKGIDEKKAELEQFLMEEDCQKFVVPVSVAVGYAIYEPEVDKSLDDTMKRADEMMYQNKQIIKKSRRQAYER